jgi:hypothetical protein
MSKEEKLIIAFWLLFFGIAIGLWVFVGDGVPVEPKCSPQFQEAKTTEEKIEKHEAEIRRLKEQQRIGNLQARP